jgi:hypothetical protein
MKIVSFALLSLATAVDARLGLRGSPSDNIIVLEDMMTGRSNGKNKFFSDHRIGSEMFSSLVVTM